MTFQSEQLAKIIKDWKPVWSTAGSVKHHDWIFFSGGYVLCYNGYFYVHTMIDMPSDAHFALSAQSALALLTGDTVEVGYTDDASFMQVKKRRVEFSYPFSLKEKIEKFYLYDKPLASRVPDQLQLIEMFGYVFPQNIEFSNVYAYNGNLYASDGYRIVMQPTTSIDAVFPFGIQKLINDQIRGIESTPDGITLSYGEYTLSAAKTMGHARAITSRIPSTLTSQWCIIPDEIFEILEATKTFGSEFKAKDLKVQIDFTKDTGTVTIKGFKSKFSDSFPCECTHPFTIYGHPNHLRDAFSFHNKFGFNVDGEFILLEREDGGIQFLWIGE